MFVCASRGVRVVEGISIDFSACLGKFTTFPIILQTTQLFYSAGLTPFPLFECEISEGILNRKKPNRQHESK